MTRARRWILGVAGVVTIVVLATASASAAPVCTATKLKAAAKDSGVKLRCHGKAAKANAAVDPTCLSKSSDKLALKFSKAETAGGCGNSGSAIAVSSEDEAARTLDSDVFEPPARTR